MSAPNEKEIRLLRESEEKYRQMIERAHDAIFAVDVKTGGILEANVMAEKLTGYTVAELTAMTVWDLHPGDQRAAAKRFFALVSSSRDGMCADLQFQTKSGERISVDVSASVIEYGDKKIIQRICRDITDRKKLESELERAKEDLEKKVDERTRELRKKQAQLVQSEKMAALGNLVAGVAHEINTPLGALKSNNDLLIRALTKMRSIVEDPGTPSTIRDHPQLGKILASIEDLNAINKSAMERIVSIVKSLRQFARLDGAERDRVDIHEGLENTLTLVHHELKNRINLHKDYGDLPPVTCFPNQINQVFMNILVNASQAIPDKGDIFIKTFKRDEDIVVEIRDTGRGIPEELLEKIFDPGFTTKGAGVGTGLGLSIVYQIVEDHDGSVEIESNVGEGTTFRVVLPIQ
ncbi:MAG: PAS domain S-box protein [bacterium]